MQGRPRKPVALLAGHGAKAKRAAAVRALPAEEQRPAPPPVPRGLLKGTRDRWLLYWNSELSDHVDRDVMMPAAQSFFEFLDERNRAWAAYRRKRFVAGSMGQVRVNPMWRVVQECEGQLAKLGDQLGMTPLARARLGLAVGEAANAMAELEDLMNEPDEPAVRDVAIEGEWKPL